MQIINFLNDSKEIGFEELNETIQDRLISDDYDPEEVEVTIKKMTLKGQDKLILSETYFDGGVGFSSKIYHKENLKEIFKSGTYISMSFVLEKEETEKESVAILHIRSDYEDTFILIEL